MKKNDKRFIAGKGMQVAKNLCEMCARKDPTENKCEAFPLGIPQEILSMEFIHTKPFPGDHEVIFLSKNRPLI
ncbi:MAG: hypothetical protein AMQ74_01815 [Candidatus Methanofastidiosum methylothiophilum]|uniref:Uncharacterized protein n=1 Tax=Candidatus Methanofastidiosum methylothiophilum TaxID=1705564 RepID=A0A150IN63_9EURY|nr:MAG: hypothetical protein AMQ74_01815 [Candidatus Methanofastidiosum methylthiophilus]